MNKLATFLGWAVVLIVLTIISGYVLSVLWGWFFVTTFGFTQISVIEAMGISLTIGYLKTGSTKDHDWEETKKAIFQGVVNMVFVLIIGWVYFQFM